MTYEQIEVLIKVFANKKIKAYYSGEHCRNEVISLIHGEEIQDKDKPTIFINTTLDKITKIFPKLKIITPYYAELDFANTIIGIESFHDYNGNHVKSLEANFIGQIFTVNSVIYKSETEIKYYHNAEEDIKNKIIKTIEDADEVFQNSPLAMLYAFKIMAQTNFVIDKSLIRSIRQHSKLLKNFESSVTQTIFRSILISKYAYKTLDLMQRLQIFSKIKLSHLTNADLSRLEKFNFDLNTEEIVWALLYNNPKYFENDVKFDIEDKTKVTINWLIDNKDTFKVKSLKELRLAILKSTETLTGENASIHFLCYLMKKILIIYKNEGSGEKYLNTLMFNLCARPYFPNQIDLNIEEDLKRKVIVALLCSREYPCTKELLCKYIKEKFNVEVDDKC